MITDDQVARLVRDAGTGAPLPRPVDLGGIEQRVRRDRTVTRTVAGTAGALAIVGLVTGWATSLPGGIPDAAAAGGNLAGSLSSGTAALLVLGVVVVAFVACGIATVRARRLPVDALARRVLAASWALLAVVVTAPLTYFFSTVVVYPAATSLPRLWKYLVPYALLLVAFSWLAAGARRRLRGRRRGGLLAALWLLTAWLAGQWVVYDVFLHLQSGAKYPVPYPGPLGFAALAALVVLSVGIARVLQRRDGHPRPLTGALGVTGLLALGVVATELWNVHDAVDGTAAGVTVTCAAVIGCVLAARLSLPRGTRTPWRTAGLAALACCAVLAAGEHVRTVLLLAASGRPQNGSLGYLVWAFALSAAAVVLLALLDRRDPWGRGVAGPGPAAPPTSASATASATATAEAEQ